MYTASRPHRCSIPQKPPVSPIGGEPLTTEIEFISAAPFSHLQAVPKDGKAITLWANKDQALMDAAKSIRRAAEELSRSIRRQ